jgi:hypothetical protein
MSLVTILGFLKSILPTKKIGAWILGIIGALVAIFMGINNSDLKATYCASEIVNLPPLPAQAPQPPAPQPETKPVAPAAKTK